MMRINSELKIFFLFWLLILSPTAYCQVVDADRADDVDTLPKKINCIIGVSSDGYENAPAQMHYHVG